MPEIVLGLNAYHADSSAAIFVDGTLLAAVEEERFQRVKHWSGFPAQSIAYCLQEANCSLDEVDAITVGRDPNAKRLRKAAFVLKNLRVAAALWRQRSENKKDIRSLCERFSEVTPTVDVQALEQKLHFIEHHRSHLASAFYSSPFDEAAILSIDGSGDFSTTMLGHGKGTQIKVLDSLDFPASLGLFYTAFTQYLGFPHYGDEYKVMGLAPYGEPKFIDFMSDVLPLAKNGLFSWDSSYFHLHQGVMSYPGGKPQVSPLFGAKISEHLGPPRQPSEPLTQRHMDVAASVQRHTEMVIFHVLNRLHAGTGLTKLCLAGGVAQNSVANGKIIENTPFDEVYIPSAGHDAGISMGSAQYHIHHRLNRPRVPSLNHAYTGTRFDNSTIEDLLKKREVNYEMMPDDQLHDIVSDALTRGAVVGWFSGRSEFGPRALGARSILVDPRRKDAKELLNAKIKRRENFRPFAPSVLIEQVEHWFDSVQDAKFMERVLPIREDKQTLIPAVTHVDGSGRLQTVSVDTNPKYHALISAFFEKTNVPILLNTSFNENEPIVHSPLEALDCFERTEMDVLVLENCLIRRPKPTVTQ